MEKLAANLATVANIFVHSDENGEVGTIVAKRGGRIFEKSSKEYFMKKFMAIYIGSASALEGWKVMDEEKRRRQEKAGKEAWGKWATANKKTIVDQGSPLGRTKRISARGISDTKNELAAYTIVQAESHEAAAKLFENHPHFMIFPGDSVEVMECLPMPER